MSKQLLTAQDIELRSALNDLDILATKAKDMSQDYTKRDESQASLLMAKIKTLREVGTTVKSDYEARWFKSFFSGAEPEYRGTDMLAGTQTPNWTLGSEGGYFVPQEFHDSLLYGMKQFDPLLDENVVTMIKSNSGALRPYPIPGWDMSALKATKVAEGAQQTPSTVPNAAQAILNGYMYRQTLDASFELEADDFQPTLEQIRGAYMIAFARGIGEDLVTGNGTTAPQGILTAAVDSGVSLDPRITVDISNTLNDAFQNAYFALNRWHRANPKCFWAMNDKTYEWIRSLTDGVGRPLIKIHHDDEILMGKKVLICPSVPAWQSSITDGKIIFGNFSQLYVRVARTTVTRNLQAAGYVDKGKGLYTGRMRADAKVLDPTGGVIPPFVSITLPA